MAEKLIELSPEDIDELMFKTWKKIMTIAPDIKFVYTVSPIPLHGVKLAGSISALEFDAISKSRVRLGLELFSRRSLPNTIYWPSYEIVRWIAPMCNSLAEIWRDPRHLSDEVIDAICGSFVQRFFD